MFHPQGAAAEHGAQHIRFGGKTGRPAGIVSFDADFVGADRSHAGQPSEGFDAVPQFFCAQRDAAR